MPKRVVPFNKAVGLVLDFNWTIYQGGVNGPLFRALHIDYEHLELAWNDRLQERYSHLPPPQARQFKPRFIYEQMLRKELYFDKSSGQPGPGAHYSVGDLRDFGAKMKLMDGVADSIEVFRQAVAEKGFDLKVGLITSTPEPMIHALPGIRFDSVLGQRYRDAKLDGRLGTPDFAQPVGSAGTAMKPTFLRTFLQIHNIDPTMVIAPFDGYSDEGLAAAVKAGGGVNIGVVNRHSPKVKADLVRLHEGYVAKGLIAPNMVVDNDWTEFGTSRIAVLEASENLPYGEALDTIRAQEEQSQGHWHRRLHLGRGSRRGPGRSGAPRDVSHLPVDTDAVEEAGVGLVDASTPETLGLGLEPRVLHLDPPSTPPVWRDAG